MQIKDFMEVVNYRITEGDTFGWTCFGENAFNLSSWNGDHDGWSFNIVFDTHDQTVYSVEACDYKRKRAYRYLNPDHRETYITYGKNNHAEFSKYIGEDCVAYPDLVSTKYPLESAAFFFEKNNLWAICDKGNSPDVVTALTKRVNGGILGLADRLKHFNHFYNSLK